MSKHPNSTIVNKDAERFQVNPSFGLLQPGQKCEVDVIFTPNIEKSILHKVEFKITNNQVIKLLTVKGVGMSQNIEFIPSKVVLDTALFQGSLGTCGNEESTENPIEVYSLDFDSRYREEEEMLRNFEGFDTGIDDDTVSQNTDVAATQRRETKVLYLAPRKPGMALWKEVATAYDKKQKKVLQANRDKEMEDKLKSESEEEKKIAEEYFRTKISDVEESRMVEEKHPNYIPETERHSLIVWGLPGRGKSYLAVSLAEKHTRALLSLNNVIEWHMQQATETGEEIKKFLAVQANKKEKDLQEREKFRKALKKVDEIPSTKKSKNISPWIYSKRRFPKGSVSVTATQV